MNLFGAIGNLVNGASHFLGSLVPHSSPQPVNRGPINLGQGSPQLQGGGTQRVQQAAPVRQAPQLLIPHINLNTNQIVHLPVQQVAPQKPRLNFAQINQAAGLNNHAPSIGTNASNNPVNRVVDVFSHMIGQPTTGQVTQQKQQLQRMTPNQRVKFQLTDPTNLKANIAALSGGNGEGNVAKSLAKPAAKGATQLIKAAQGAVHFPDFLQKAGSIAQKTGADFKSIDDAVGFFQKHNTKGKIVNPNNFANPYTLQGAGKQTPLISKIAQPTPEQVLANVRAARVPTPAPSGVIANLKKYIGNNRGGASIGTMANVATGGAPTAVKGIGKLKVPDAFNRVNNVIGKVSPQTAEMIRSIDRTAMTNTGHVYNQMADTLKGLNNKDFATAVDVQRGKIKPSQVSPQIQQAAKQMGQVFNEVHARATAGGVPVSGFQKNYFPEVSKSGKTGEVQNSLFGKNSPTKQGNLENARLGNIPEGDLKKTKDVFLNYVHSANRRIAQVETLGLHNEKSMGQLKADAKAAGIKPTSPEFTRLAQLHDVASGALRAPNSKVIDNILKYNSATKLGRAFVSNLTQSGNTAAVTGWPKTIGAIAGTLRGKDQALVNKSGVQLNPIIQEMEQLTTGTKGLASKFGAPLFNPVEKFNRGVSARAGMSVAKSAAKKEGRQLTEQELIKAAQDMTHRTQFTLNPGELPAGATQSQVGRLGMQYRTFPYNQSAFIGREILNPLSKGNVKPLINYGIGTAALGTGAVAAKNLLSNKQPTPQTPAQQAVGILGAAGGTGLTDPLLQIGTGDKKYRTDNILSSLLGPSYGTVKTGAQAVTDATTGKYGNVAKTATKQIPGVGVPAANALFPNPNNPPGPLSTLFGGKPAGAAAPNAAHPTALQQQQNKAQISKLEAKIKAIGLQKGNPDKQNQQIKQLYTQIAALKGNHAPDNEIKKQLDNNGGNLQITDNKIFYRNASGNISTINTKTTTTSQKNTAIKNVFQLLQDQSLSQKDATSVFKKLGVSAQQAETTYAKALPTVDKGAYVLDKLKNGGAAVQLAKDGILTTTVANSLRTGGDISQADYVALYKVASANNTELAKERKAGGIGSSGKAKKLPKVPTLKLAKIKSSSIKFKGVSVPKAKAAKFKTYKATAPKTKQVTLA